MNVVQFRYANKEWYSWLYLEVKKFKDGIPVKAWVLNGCWDYAREGNKCYCMDGNRIMTEYTEEHPEKYVIVPKYISDQYPKAYDNSRGNYQWCVDWARVNFHLAVDKISDEAIIAAKARDKEDKAKADLLFPDDDIPF